MRSALAILIWIIVPAVAWSAPPSPPDRPCPAAWECLSPEAVSSLLSAEKAAKRRCEADHTLLRREAAAELDAERRGSEARARVARVELEVVVGALAEAERDRDRRPSRLAAVLWAVGAGVAGLGAGVVVGVLAERF